MGRRKSKGRKAKTRRKVKMAKMFMNHVLVAPVELKPHPRNYREHPDDQLEHIVESIEENGVYRNVVVARDDTILAGHGVVLAARKMKLDEIPVIRLDLDPDDPKALKVLTGDNEISNLVEVDDRVLTLLLKDIKNDDDLLGTGFDEKMLANLLMVTRPASEIEDFDEAAHWVGMPEYDSGELALKMVVSFRSEADRSEFADKLGLKITEKTRGVWWPQREREDLSAVKFEG